MEVTHRTVGEVGILEIVGDIDLFNTSQIQSIVQNLAAEKIFRVIFNLERVSYIDSSGIGMFLTMLRHLKKAEGGLKLLKLSVSVRKVFEMARIISVFEVFDDEESAIQSFK